MEKGITTKNVCLNLFYKMSFSENHFRNTEKLIRALPTEKVAFWLLNHGFYPEQNILPPQFQVTNFILQKKEYFQLSKIAVKGKKKIIEKRNIPCDNLLLLGYPKTSITERGFGIQNPKYYHDLVFYLMKSWKTVLRHLFPKGQKIFSYSFPIPIREEHKGKTPLRAGRMVYEWLSMAEGDLVIDAHKYEYIVQILLIFTTQFTLIV